MPIKFEKKETYQVVIDGENTVLASRCKPAADFFSRFIGLMFRESLDDEEALLIVPCNSIHTFFMRFPIDLVFLDREWNVVTEKRNIAPGRIISPINGAWAVVELKGGRIDFMGIGDSIAGRKVRVEPVPKHQ